MRVPAGTCVGHEWFCVAGAGEIVCGGGNGPGGHPCRALVGAQQFGNRTRLHSRCSWADSRRPLDDVSCSVLVEWEGLGSSWGAVSKIREDTPKVLES